VPENAVAPEAPVDQHVAEQAHEQAAVGQRGRDPGALQSERWQAEGAEDQRVGAERVEADSEQHHDHGGARPLERCDEVAQDDEPERRHEPPHRGMHIALGRADQHRVLVQEPEHRDDVPEHGPGRQAERERHPEALADRPPRLAHRMPPAAEIVRHHRRGRGHDPDREQQQHEADVDPEHARRQRLGAEPAEHQDVGRLDRDLAQIGQHDRQAQRDERPRLPPPGAGAGPIPTNGSHGAVLPQNRRPRNPG
jgi:hypothetical protein